MTGPDLPMPASGGTYVRDPVTGALTEMLPGQDHAPLADQAGKASQSSAETAPENPTQSRSKSNTKES